MATMNTYTGNKIDPMNMAVADISIQDIAHALSLTCRGGGHVSYFFSVAQHSINCMNEAKARDGQSGYSLPACCTMPARRIYQT
jgi:hypothetical protein